MPAEDRTCQPIGSGGLSLLARFAGQRVVVVGDVMLDRYWWGTVKRVSPEAPVPVVTVERTTTEPGGAANVAANVAGLGGIPRLVGIIGDDGAGRSLCKVLDAAGVESDKLVVSSKRPTTLKTRILGSGKHIVRIDEESIVPACGNEADLLLKYARTLLATAHVLVLSDYGKGALAPSIVAALIEAARSRGLPIVVDPKGNDYGRYRGATLLAPNQLEAALAAGLSPDLTSVVQESGNRLLERIDVDAIIVTEGHEGLTLFRRGQAAVRFGTRSRVVYDVTGAGDSVVAALGLALGGRADLVTAALLANVAGGLAVEQVGTAIVTTESLQRALS